jgi:hypothetical protein
MNQDDKQKKTYANLYDSRISRAKIKELCKEFSIPENDFHAFYIAWKDKKIDDDSVWRYYMSQKSFIENNPHICNGLEAQRNLESANRYIQEIKKASMPEPMVKSNCPELKEHTLENPLEGISDKDDRKMLAALMKAALIKKERNLNGRFPLMRSNNSPEIVRRLIKENYELGSVLVFMNKYIEYGVLQSSIQSYFHKEKKDMPIFR